MDSLPANPVDNVLVLNACDDPDRPAAASANFNVDIEYALESLGPGHGSMALGRCLYFRIFAHLKCLATFGRGNLPAPPVIRGKNAMVSCEIAPGFWYECCQSCDEIDGVEDHLGCSVPAGRLQGVTHFAGRA